MSAATIRLRDMELVMATSKARRVLDSKLGWFCALSEHPTIQLDCSTRNRMYADPESRERAQRFGMSRARFMPMDRGHIAGLIERTRWMHGLAEVRKTWRTGIRALLAESRYSLKGGAA